MISHREKLFWPEEGITKGDLVAYYERAAERMLPYMSGRPLMLERYPDGMSGESFFEKEVPPGAPAWVKTFSIYSASRDRMIAYVVCDDRRTLCYLADLAVVTPHVWQSRVTALDNPDVLLFDLDPAPECPLRRVARVAVELRDMLAAVGLNARVKTTGSKGLHVIVALYATTPYSEARDFAERIVRAVVQGFPSEASLERSPSKREPSTLYLDYVQIGKGKTFAPPYAVRARPGAPVSYPILWDDVEQWVHSRERDSLAMIRRHTIADALEEPDPWKGSYGKPQYLSDARHALDAVVRMRF